MYTRESIMMPIIMFCKLWWKKAKEFGSKLGFKQHDVIMSKKQSVIKKRSFLIKKLLNISANV